MATLKKRDLDDEELALEAEKAAKLEREQLLADAREVVTSAAGVRFLSWFFQRGYLFSTTFTGNSYGNFQEGSRNLALAVFDVLVQAAPVETLTALIMQIKGGNNDGNGNGNDSSRPG